jgi:peptide/nickel transport system substrate-binding protein
MFEKQEIDETELLPEQFLQCADDERFAEVGVLGYKSKWSFNYIAWNMDGSNPFFADRRVRRAMSYAIDYDRIRQQVYHGLYAQSLGVFHPDSPAGNPNIEPYTFHLDRAQALLDDAGWHRDAEDGWRYKEVPTDGGVERRRFSFSLLVPTASSSGPNFAAIYQEDLARIGVEMTPRMIEWSAFLEMIRKHDFEAQLSSFGTAVDPDYAWNVFHSESSEHGRNYMSYANPDVDRLFAAGRAEFDNDRRMTIYRELAKTLYDDAAVTCIVDVPTLWAFNKRLRGVTFSPRGPNLFSPGVLNWWVQKGMGLHDAPSP